MLTALHVVQPHLVNPYHPETNTGGVRCVAVTDGPAGQSQFDCAVVWQNEAADLALLQIAEAGRQLWWDRLIDEPPTVLAATGTDPILDVSAIGFPDATLDHDAKRPDPDQPTGTLLPSSGIPSRISFDVSGSTPDDHLLWQGLSGAAVRDAASGRLFAIVAQAVPDRAARRLYASPLPDPDTDPKWAAELKRVSAVPVLEDRYAPEARRFLTCYDPAGRPWRVGRVPRLGDFGVRLARDDLTLDDQPYFPLVSRPDAGSVEAAIKAALADGGAPRMILLVGESAVGKSRLAAEVVTRMPALAGYRFVRPSPTQPIGDLPEVFRRGRVLLWLDDLHRYLASDLDAQQVRELLSNPQLVIVATVLRESLRAFTQSDFKTGATDLLTDDTLIARLDIIERPNWSIGDASPRDADLIRAALHAADRAGVGLGEYLAAYAELRNRYRNTGQWARSLIDCVADWSRTGMFTALPEPLARDLWQAHYLPAAQARQWDLKTGDDQESIYEEARKDGATPALGSTALLDRTRHGLLPSDIALIVRASVAVPDGMWMAAAQIAAEDPAQALSVAFQAALAHQSQIAERLWKPLIGRDPTAAFNLGLVRKDEGDLAGAAEAYQLAIDSGHAEAAPRAAVTLGILRKEQGDLAGAAAAWQLAIDSGHTEHTPSAAFDLGLLRQEQGDLARAAAAYQLAIDSGDAEHAPKAAVNLGLLRQEQGDLVGATAAYQLAIDCGQAEYAAMAAVGFGAVRKKQGDLAGAAATWQLAIDSGHTEAAPAAAFNLGLHREQQGDLAEAVEAYQLAIDSGHTEHAPAAAFALGALRQQQGDLAEAVEAYQQAVDSGHAEHAPKAAFNLGLVREEQGDLAEAVDAYQLAIDSGRTESAPRAAMHLGALRLKQGDLAGAAAAYQQAVESGHAEHAAAAAFNLGLVRNERGDLAGAAAAWQLTIDSGHAEHAPAAAFNLGALRHEQGDLAEAVGAYQLAIHSRHAEHAPKAAVNLGALRQKQGDLAGAAAAYQQAIDSGHADGAPRAAVHLGALRAQQGDLAGAAAAYQQAIDSGHAEHAPAAAFNLGLVRNEQGDLAGAAAAWQLAIDSGHAEVAPKAAMTVRLLRGEQGDPAGAADAHQVAIDPRHSE